MTKQRTPPETTEELINSKEALRVLTTTVDRKTFDKFNSMCQAIERSKIYIIRKLIIKFLDGEIKIM